MPVPKRLRNAAVARTCVPRAQQPDREIDTGKQTRLRYRAMDRRRNDVGLREIGNRRAE